MEAPRLRDIPGLGARDEAAIEQRAAEFSAFRGCIPPVHVQRILRLMARAIGIPAVRLWLLPASEFFFCYHVNLTDEDKTLGPLPEVVR